MPWPSIERRLRNIFLVKQPGSPKCQIGSVLPWLLVLVQSSLAARAPALEDGHLHNAHGTEAGHCLGMVAGLTGLGMSACYQNLASLAGCLRVHHLRYGTNKHWNQKDLRGPEAEPAKPFQSRYLLSSISPLWLARSVCLSLSRSPSLSLPLCLSLSLYLYMYIHTYINLHRYTPVRYMCLYMYACLCICMYVSINK